MLLSVQTRYLPCTSERENYAKYTWEMQNVRMNYEAVSSAMTVLSSTGRAETGRQYHRTVNNEQQ